VLHSNEKLLIKIASDDLSTVAAGDIFFGGGAVGRRGLNITQQ